MFVRRETAHLVALCLILLSLCHDNHGTKGKKWSLRKFSPKTVAWFERRHVSAKKRGFLGQTKKRQQIEKEKLAAENQKAFEFSLNQKGNIHKGDFANDYEFMPDKVKREVAVKVCEDRGGMLAFPTNETENQELQRIIVLEHTNLNKKELYSDHQVWTGLSRDFNNTIRWHTTLPAFKTYKGTGLSVTAYFPKNGHIGNSHRTHWDQMNDKGQLPTGKCAKYTRSLTRPNKVDLTPTDCDDEARYICAMNTTAVLYRPLYRGNNLIPYKD